MLGNTVKAIRKNDDVSHEVIWIKNKALIFISSKCFKNKNGRQQMIKVIVTFVKRKPVVYLNHSSYD